MSTELVIKHSIADIQVMAKAMANSGLFGMKNAEQALALMLVAQAEGLHPATAAMEFNIIQNKPARTSESILTRFQKAGGKVEWHEYNDEKVSATFSHPQGSPVLIEWDMARAKNAGLVGKDNWKKWPRNMLACRVISEGCRRVFPGSTGGLYTPDEVEDFDKKVSISSPSETLRSKLGLSDSKLEDKLSLEDGNTIDVPSQFDSIKTLVQDAKNRDEFKKAWDYTKSLSPQEKESLRSLYEEKMDCFNQKKVA
jgi:hypothetical protein